MCTVFKLLELGQFYLEDTGIDRKSRSFTVGKTTINQFYPLDEFLFSGYHQAGWIAHRIKREWSLMSISGSFSL